MRRLIGNVKIEASFFLANAFKHRQSRRQGLETLWQKQ
jgi:hypothetical protein